MQLGVDLGSSGGGGGSSIHRSLLCLGRLLLGGKGTALSSLGTARGRGSRASVESRGSLGLRLGLVETRPLGSSLGILHDVAKEEERRHKPFAGCWRR